MPNSASPEEIESPSPFQLPPLSQLGALTGRFIHDLANNLSSASTILTFLREPDIDTPPSKEDMDEMSAALERSVALIHQFGAVTRFLRSPPTPISYAEIAPKIQALAATYPNITLNAAPSPEGTPNIIGHTEWLLHCIAYAATQFASRQTDLTLSFVATSKTKTPVDYYPYDKPSQFFRVEFSATADKKASSKKPAATDLDIGLLVVKELLRHMHGFLLTSVEQGRDTFSIHLGSK